MAVCAPQAIRIDGIDPTALSLKTLDVPDAWVPYGRGDAAALFGLMRSRRSCRRYTTDPVARSVLEDLVRMGTTAPSGTNSQVWCFTVLPTRAAVVGLATGILDYFKRLNRLAANPLARGLTRLVGRSDLSAYYANHYRAVEAGIQAWEQHSVDRLFHGATAVILVSARPGGSTPGEDALLATQNILLAAHAMGLGSCLIGFAVAALRRDRQIQTRIGIPAEAVVHAAIALGHPKQVFVRAAGRKPLTLRWSE